MSSLGGSGPRQQRQRQRQRQQQRSQPAERSRKPGRRRQRARPLERVAHRSYQSKFRTSQSTCSCDPGGWELIRDMLIELSEFCPLAERMVTAGFSDLDALIPSAGTGIAKSSRSPRLRQRANRKKIAVFFVAVSMIALAWSRSGGVIDHTPHHVPATIAGRKLCSFASGRRRAAWTPSL